MYIDSYQRTDVYSVDKLLDTNIDQAQNVSVACDIRELRRYRDSSGIYQCICRRVAVEHKHFCGLQKLDLSVCEYRIDSVESFQLHWYHILHQANHYLSTYLYQLPRLKAMCIDMSLSILY